MFDAHLHRRSVQIPISRHAPQGEQMAVSVIDAGSPRATQALVFVHGFGGRAAYWSHQLEHFADFYRVIAPDLRGHGLSDAPAQGYDIEQLSADLAAILQAVNAPPVVTLVCHSFGGAVCTQFLQTHAHRVDKWVVIGSPVRFSLRPFAQWVLRLPPRVLQVLRRVVKRLNVYPSAHVVHEQYRQAVSCWDGSALLRQLATPTLIVRGERDFLFAEQHFADFLKCKPNASEWVIPVSAHQVMVERPDAVHRAMDQFLGNIDWRGDRARRQAHYKAIERERPWIKWYDSRTPIEIRPPLGPASRYLETAERRFAHTDALVFLRKRISYKRLNQWANRLASGLSDLGLGKGDRMVIALPNTPQAVLAYYAALKVGAVVVFVHPRQLSAAQIWQRAHEVGAKILLALSGQAQALGPIAAHSPVQHLVLTPYHAYMHPLDVLQHWLSGKSPYLDRWGALRRLAQALRWPGQGGGAARDRVLQLRQLMPLQAWQSWNPPLQVDVNDLAVLQYTSTPGVDGQSPKMAALSHSQLASNALQMRHWYVESRPGDERILCHLPFSNTYGLVAALNLAPLLGAALILLPHSEPLAVAQAIRQHRPTLFPSVPQMYQALAYLPGIRRYGVSSIRLCLCAGSPLPIEVQETFEKLTRGRVIDSYGLAEGGAVLASPLSARRRMGSMGIALPNVELRVVDARTQADCPPDQIGELWLKGPQAMLGYWDKVQQCVQPQGPWVKTGDWVHQDADGFVYFVERQDNCIWLEVAGQSHCLYPREAEDKLVEHPAIAQVAVTLSAAHAAATASARGAAPTHTELMVFYVVQAGYECSEEAFLQWAASILQTQLPQWAALGVRLQQARQLKRMPLSAAGRIDRVQLQLSLAHPLYEYWGR